MVVSIVLLLLFEFFQSLRRQTWGWSRPAHPTSATAATTSRSRIVPRCGNRFHIRGIQVNRTGGRRRQWARRRRIGPRRRCSVGASSYTSRGPRSSRSRRCSLCGRRSTTTSGRRRFITARTFDGSDTLRSFGQIRTPTTSTQTEGATTTTTGPSHHWRRRGRGILRRTGAGASGRHRIVRGQKFGGRIAIGGSTAVGGDATTPETSAKATSAPRRGWGRCR